MKKIFIFLLIIIVLTIYFSKNVKSLERQYYSLNEPNATYGKTKKTIDLKVDLDEQKKLQTEVDNGHQPWRLEPVDVAFAALVTIDKNIDYSNCQLNTAKNIEAEVICKGTKKYRVYLRRMVKPNGIWTATVIELYTTP